MDIEQVLQLISGAVPAWDRMKEDQKRVKLWFQDWEEAIAAAPDDQAKAALYGMVPALLMKLPMGWTFNLDPLKDFRFLADDFARAGNFQRYKARRKL